jgi:hypothetical protein
MNRLRYLSVAVSLGLGAVLITHNDAADASPVTLRPPSVSEYYDQLPPLLLPESAAPPLTKRPDGVGNGGEAVFRFVVDTLGRVELATVETLAATDSVTASDMRQGLSGLRYIPARIVLNVGHCVNFNGVRAHCGGTRPAVKRLRSRVVLQLLTHGDTAR